MPAKHWLLVALGSAIRLSVVWGAFQAVSDHWDFFIRPNGWAFRNLPDLIYGYLWNVPSHAAAIIGACIVAICLLLWKIIKQQHRLNPRVKIKFAKAMPDLTWVHLGVEALSEENLPDCQTEILSLANLSDPTEAEQSYILTPARLAWAGVPDHIYGTTTPNPNKFAPQQLSRGIHLVDFVESRSKLATGSILVPCFRVVIQRNSLTDAHGCYWKPGTYRAVVRASGLTTSGRERVYLIRWQGAPNTLDVQLEKRW